MKILIIGLGYAGKRFKKAFELCGIKNIQHINRNGNIKNALLKTTPDIVVMSATDLSHFNVLKDMKDYKGFVICEKPLVTPNDDLNYTKDIILNKRGFCFNLIERYSEITIKMKKYVKDKNLKLIRANFQWGKDRLNDKRNTCGVISEIIHGLDLIQHICQPNYQYRIHSVSGCVSDFSISGDSVLDSALMTATLGDIPVTSYSSFVNIIRRRDVDLTFLDSSNNIVYANLIYDTPEWDYDHLKIWRPTNSGDEIIYEFSTSVDKNDKDYNTIRKVVALVKDVINKVQFDIEPLQPFPDQNTAINLQCLLNEISIKVKKIGPVKYNAGERVFFNESGDLEKLG